MPRFGPEATVLSCLAFTFACGELPDSQNLEPEPVQRSSAAVTGACGLAQPAFCDPFNAPAGTGNRSGQLNGTAWGVSRATGNNSFGQNQLNAWGATQLDTCNGTISGVQPENDVIICNGQLREAVNDLHTVTTLAMYPKQPFDFAGRTGVITFDVSNDTLGTHSEWPELWISDQPVPTPFTFQASWLAAPRHALGLRFDAETAPGQGGILAAACPNDAKARWSVGSAIAVRNYVVDDQENGGAIRAQRLDCVTRASGPGQMNHIEVRVSTSQIDVYATDAGTTAPLKHIAVVPNANLSFTRGLIWIEDAHYNAEKGGGPTQHTFAWDNVGFDGPVLARDLTFDAPDALQPVGGYPGQINLGWRADPPNGRPFTISGVSGIANATAGLLTFNFHHDNRPQNLTYVINGHSHAITWPFPDTGGYMWRTLAVPVTLSELTTGTNSVNIYSTDQVLVIANVDIVLAGAGGVVNP